jgi:hypothetical protein
MLGALRYDEDGVVNRGGGFDSIQSGRLVDEQRSHHSRQEDGIAHGKDGQVARETVSRIIGTMT